MLRLALLGLWLHLFSISHKIHSSDIGGGFWEEWGCSGDSNDEYWYGIGEA